MLQWFSMWSAKAAKQIISIEIGKDDQVKAYVKFQTFLSNNAPRKDCLSMITIFKIIYLAFFSSKSKIIICSLVCLTM